MNARRILHSGPPIAWERMCGPMQGAIIGAILFEGWASDLEAAEQLAASGAIAFAPCHHHGAVGPMAGIISPSMPVWIVRDPATGRRTFSNLNEGLGKVLRFGANGTEVIDRLNGWRAPLARARGGARRRPAAFEVKPLIAQALHMGDEVHNRNAAATSLLLQAPGAGDAALARHSRGQWQPPSPSSPATIISSSISRWRPARLMMDAARGVPAAAWSRRWRATA